MSAEQGRYCFVSDVHLGVKSDPQGLREKTFVAFLRSLPSDTRALFLLGDIFDFWVEYRDVVPRGYTRVFGELARLSDAGCRIYFYRGNHDWWVTDYFQKELGIEVVDEPCRIFDLDGTRFCLGHGDAMCCSDFKTRLVFRLFRNRFLVRLLKALPAHLIFKFARWWSSKSRKNGAGYSFDVRNSEILRFAENYGEANKVDVFIFGHCHTPSSTVLGYGGRLYILGDWALGANCLYFSGMGISGLGFPNIQM